MFSLFWLFILVSPDLIFILNLLIHFFSRVLGNSLLPSPGNVSVPHSIEFAVSGWRGELHKGHVCPGPFPGRAAPFTTMISFSLIVIRVRRIVFIFGFPGRGALKNSGLSAT
jgi:hypothetical protein